MSRGFDSRGYGRQITPPPEAYLDLVTAFGGEAAADFYVADLVSWATGEQAQEVLDAAQDTGSPASALSILRAAPVARAQDFTAELDQPVVGLAFSAPATPLAGMPARATDL